MSKEPKSNQKWSHDRPCDYCKTLQIPNCNHYRGGKTARDRGARYQRNTSADND